MRTRNKKSGFTLVELMIVAAIVAILAAIVVPLLANNRERAIIAEGHTMLGTLATAAKVYYAQEGEWPAFEELPQIVQDEVKNAKYWTDPKIDGDDTAMTFTIEATAKENAGRIKGMTLALNEQGVWTETGASDDD